MSKSGESAKFEWLTMEICHEYKRRADQLPPNGMQDTGERRKLRIELQKRCHLTAIEAINILNGYYFSVYVNKYDILRGRIAPPEGFEVRGFELVKIETKRPTDRKIREYEERIAYLEEKARKNDDFGFEEKD